MRSRHIALSFYKLKEAEDQRYRYKHDSLQVMQSRAGSDSDDSVLNQNLLNLIMTTHFQSTALKIHVQDEWQKFCPPHKASSSFYSVP